MHTNTNDLLFVKPIVRNGEQMDFEVDSGDAMLIQLVNLVWILCLQVLYIYINL